MSDSDQKTPVAEHSPAAEEAAAQSAAAAAAAAQAAAAQPAAQAAAAQAAAPTQEPEADERSTGKKRWDQIIIGGTRLFAIIPCIGLLAAAVALMIVTLISTVQVTIEAIEDTIELQDLMVEYIEFADFFLLAIVLYIMSVGLYSLFIDDSIPMPEWLEIHNLEDLKEKLIGVIVVVMGVYFLGKLIHNTDATDLLCLGVGIAAVVLALGYFARFVIIGDESSAPSESTKTIIMAHPGTTTDASVTAADATASTSNAAASDAAAGTVIAKETTTTGAAAQK